MYILGLNAYHGDCSACLFKDNKIIAAIEEERIQLEQQKLLTDAAVKQAEIESKDRQMNLKSLEAAEKIGQQDEKDEAQLTLQLMQQLDKEK